MRPQTTAVVTEHTAISVNNVNTMRILENCSGRAVWPRRSMKVHALDEGSTVTLIDEQVANRIGAKGRRETLRVSCVGNEITDENRGSFELKSKAFSKLETHDSSDHQKPEASSATRGARHRRSLLALDRYR
ncbi:hypothetical protein EVAR_91818_1 [Eumeta japonica]|uniref:Uncharacterized protein n=1 Tax=Eumeta variegata TaxID=151549 RepID=A0A4C1T7W1_EUMVA|nr:hypothetical protein EVAR_91818_1 [Eumeta japonica]